MFFFLPYFLFLFGGVELSESWIRNRYIIILDEPALVQYEGQISGYPEVARENGSRINLRSREARAYRSLLEIRQQEILSQIRGVDPNLKIHFQYTTVANAVVVETTQIKTVQELSGVRKIQKDGLYQGATDTSIELVGAPAFWENPGLSLLGENMKLAVIDGGIRPEHPSFNGTGFEPMEGYPLADSYCGTGGDPSFCNGKIINARYYEPPSLPTGEYLSPYAFAGHGVHVSAIAAGNINPDVNYQDTIHTLSGIAPRARIMVYKALYWQNNNIYGTSSMLVAAIEDAVNDGADVINNSWSELSTGSFNDFFAAEAIENATAAGVIVVAAAGNTGPNSKTIDCPGCAPSAITVGNSSTGRQFLTKLAFPQLETVPVSLSNLGVLASQGTEPELKSAASMIFMKENINGCAAYTATGKIVIVKEGSCNLETQITQAVAAGASGLIVVKAAPGYPEQLTPNAPAIPVLSMSFGQGNDLIEYLLQNSETEVQCEGISAIHDERWQDVIASNSSRGPSYDGILKPDITAPGYDILAANSIEQGELYSLKSGTSMSAPHVAGAALLLRERYPDLTPAQIKSVLMTTANPNLRKEDFRTDADPFDMGSGRLDLNTALHAGLAFDQASFFNSQCISNCSWQVTAQNITNEVRTWQLASHWDDVQLKLEIEPDQITLKPGESRTINLRLSSVLGQQEQWQFGALIWQDLTENNPTRDARMPLAIYPKTSSDLDTIQFTVDKSEAMAGDILNYEVRILNLEHDDQFQYSNAYPEGVIFDVDSLSVTVDGEGVTPIVSETGLAWSGLLQQPDLGFSAIPRTYTSLTDIGISPFACSGVCDDFHTEVTGLDFYYFGKHYTQVAMTTNGFIVVGDDIEGAWLAEPQALPSTSVPNNVIAPFWADFDLDGSNVDDSGQGNWYFATVNGELIGGEPGSQYHVFEWKDALEKSENQQHSFQVHIKVGTDEISFHYGPLGLLPANISIGSENYTGELGKGYYTDGQGTAPNSDEAVEVSQQIAEGLVVNYQVRVAENVASRQQPPIINLASLQIGALSLDAFAATHIKCPPPIGFYDALPLFSEEISILELLSLLCQP